MEELQSAFQKFSKDAKSMASSLSQPPPPPPPPPSSSFSSGVIVTRPPRGVSVWTCSKLCAVFFVAGVFVGYTLKRRVRRWVSSLLRRLKDD
ncbi:hypothetical protein RND81_08G033700 [Saponaria officinalis]|uniref:Transmembrane protein n=1 Tax=Saponaria officinalis TaxID=3572 RepID=A0AAW1J256_SAPOF